MICFWKLLPIDTNPFSLLLKNAVNQMLWSYPCFIFFALFSGPYPISHPYTALAILFLCAKLSWGCILAQVLHRQVSCGFIFSSRASSSVLERLEWHQGYRWRNQKPSADQKQFRFELTGCFLFKYPQILTVVIWVRIDLERYLIDIFQCLSSDPVSLPYEEFHIAIIIALDLLHCHCLIIIIIIIVMLL